MKHIALFIALAQGIAWAALVAVVACYMALNEEFLRAFDRWRA